MKSPYYKLTLYFIGCILALFVFGFVLVALDTDTVTTKYREVATIHTYRFDNGIYEGENRCISIKTSRGIIEKDMFTYDAKGLYEEFSDGERVEVYYELIYSKSTGRTRVDLQWRPFRKSVVHLYP